MRSLAKVMAGLVVAVGAVALGAWWAPFFVAAAIGLVESRARLAITAGAFFGLLAWSLPLGVAELRYGLGPTAQSIAAIMGFTHQAEVPIILTCLVGLLLGLTGAWLGSAARALAQPATSR